MAKFWSQWPPPRRAESLGPAWGRLQREGQRWVSGGRGGPHSTGGRRRKGRARACLDGGLVLGFAGLRLTVVSLGSNVMAPPKFRDLSLHQAFRFLWET